MGVKGLLNILKSIQKPCNLQSFQGQTIGVDAYCWLHRGAVASALDLGLGQPSRKHVSFAMHRVRMLLHFGIQPYIVFDGDNLPSKAWTEQSRASRRTARRNAGLELLKMGKKSQAIHEFKKAVDVSPEMAKEFIEELKILGVRYIVAPYEADAQLTYLENKGFIDGIISEDSDLLVFGSRCLLTKLDNNGDCIMIRSEDFVSCKELDLHDWTHENLRMMAILAGCDYLEGIHNIGIKTAYQLIRKHKTIDRVIRAAQLEGKLRIPPNYLDHYSHAEITFLHQWVFCPETQCLVHLTEPSSPSLLEGVTCIGTFVPRVMAQKIATGEVNPITKLPMHTQPKHLRFKEAYLMSTKGAKNNDNNGTSQTDRQIDSFFKSERSPLTEVHVNCAITPSETPNLLRSSKSVPNSSFLTANGTGPFPIANTSLIFGKGSQVPATNTQKHRQNCGNLFDEVNLSKAIGEDLKYSKFFPISQLEPTPSSHGTSRKRRMENDEVGINIFSDDSIDEAATLLRTPKYTRQSITTNGTKKFRRNMSLKACERNYAFTSFIGDGATKSIPEPSPSLLELRGIENNSPAVARGSDGEFQFEFNCRRSPNPTNTLTNHVEKHNCPPAVLASINHRASSSKHFRRKSESLGKTATDLFPNVHPISQRGSEDLYVLQESENESEYITSSPPLNERFIDSSSPIPRINIDKRDCPSEFRISATTKLEMGHQEGLPKFPNLYLKSFEYREE